MKKSSHKITGDIALIILFLIIFIARQLGIIKDSNYISILIALVALAFVVKDTFYRIQEQNEKIEVIHIKAREKDEKLKEDMEVELNKIRLCGCKVDSIQMLQATGYNDGRKEVYIIYH